jgi:hypothetical protein
VCPRCPTSHLLCRIPFHDDSCATFVSFCWALFFHCLYVSFCLCRARHLLDVYAPAFIKIMKFDISIFGLQEFNEVQPPGSWWYGTTHTRIHTHSRAHTHTHTYTHTHTHTHTHTRARANTRTYTHTHTHVAHTHTHTHTCSTHTHTHTHTHTCAGSMLLTAKINEAKDMLAKRARYNINYTNPITLTPSRLTT